MCVCNHGYLCVPQILTFKEISWQMIRIEADAIQSAQNEMLSAPIRLITNQSKIRVTLKRRVQYATHMRAWKRTLRCKHTHTRLIINQSKIRCQSEVAGRTNTQHTDTP